MAICLILSVPFAWLFSLVPYTYLRDGSVDLGNAGDFYLGSAVSFIFISGVLILLRMFFSFTPCLRLDDKGLVHRVLGARAVYWRDVDRIYKYSTTVRGYTARYIQLDFTVQPKSGWFRDGIKQMNKFLRIPHREGLSIQTNYIAVSEDELLEEMQLRWQAAINASQN